MKIIIQLFKKYPAGFLVLLLYSILCIIILREGLQFDDSFEHRQPGEGGIILSGKGAMFLDIFLFLVGSAIIFVTCGYIIFSKNKTQFYLWLILAIIIETGLTFYFE